jgi:hypothetical protein
MIKDLFRKVNPNECYKFKDLKVFGSTDTLYQNTKRYRRVFEKLETDHIYAELSFYNKFFDVKEWNITLSLKCVVLKRDSIKEFCSIDREIKVSINEPVIIFREGWGNEIKGEFWELGDYQWNAYIDGKLVASTEFYIENSGPVIDNANPYFDLESIQLYEGQEEGVALNERKYTNKFISQDTAYIWASINLKNKVTQAWYCELIFSFVSEQGHLKGITSELKYLSREDGKVEIKTGWGSTEKGTWKHGIYRMEVIFMDRLIATIPFEVVENDIS